MGLFSWARRPKTESSAEGPTNDRGLSELTPEREGVACIAAGQFVQATAAFRKAIERSPLVAAHHVNLAFALQQCDADEDAEIHLRRAIELDATSFDAQYMLGLSAERRGDFVDAARQLKKAASLNADFAAVHGDLCRVLSSAGDMAASAEAICAAIARFPEHAEFHVYLGNVRMKEGAPLDAIAHYDHAIAAEPRLTTAYVNRAVAFQELKRFEEAVPSLDFAIELEPRSAELHDKLAAAWKGLREWPKAQRAAELAIELAPMKGEFHNHLGTILQESGRIDDAISCYARAIALQPELPGGHANLGFALQEKGDLHGAIAACRRSLSIQPMAETHNHHAMALTRMGAVVEAIEIFELALALQPDHLSARCNLAAALSDAGRQQEAIETYREVLRRDPDSHLAHSNMLFYLSVDDSTTPAAYLDAARAFDRTMKPMPYDRSRAANLPGRKLRVGFVSADFIAHPVGYFVEGMLQHLDRHRLELFAYPTANKEDELSRRIKPHFTVWRSVRAMTDPEAVRSIRSDELDLLLDLSGHTGGNRLGIFGARAAPVQIAWLGFFASTGLSAMDYVLADEACVPRGNEYQFTERVWRLPDTRLCFTPPATGAETPVMPLPALTNGYVTFGCFQRWSKIHPRVLALWSRVFAAIPNARLLLQSLHGRQPEQVEDMLSRLEQAGIERRRVQIRGSVKRDEYLRSYADVDIVLDTFPYTGGTTTCEALWMGVPTLTLAGDSMISLQGVALLQAAGMPEWIAADFDEYVTRAASFAKDVTKLAVERAAMRARVERSVLFDTALFARRFEDALFALAADHAGSADSRAKAGSAEIGRSADAGVATNEGK